MKRKILGDWSVRTWLWAVAGLATVFAIEAVVAKVVA